MVEADSFGSFVYFRVHYFIPEVVVGTSYRNGRIDMGFNTAEKIIHFLSERFIDGLNRFYHFCQLAERKWIRNPDLEGFFLPGLFHA